MSEDYKNECHFIGVIPPDKVFPKGGVKKSIYWWGSNAGCYITLLLKNEFNGKENTQELTISANEKVLNGYTPRVGDVISVIGAYGVTKSKFWKRSSPEGQTQDYYEPVWFAMSVKLVRQGDAVQEEEKVSIKEFLDIDINDIPV
jgi:hypothetical protein